MGWYESMKCSQLEHIFIFNVATTDTLPKMASKLLTFYQISLALLFGFQKVCKSEVHNSENTTVHRMMTSKEDGMHQQ